MPSELDHVFVCALLVSPRAGVSPELQAVVDANLVQLHAGGEYCIELGFDGESQGQTRDLRPALPLVLRW
jgi:hypothetical protein